MFEETMTEAKSATLEDFKEKIASEENEDEVSRLAETLRTIPGVKERYVGLEERQFRIRPSLFIDEVLIQPGAVEKIQSAIDELLLSISRYS